MLLKTREYFRTLGSATTHPRLFASRGARNACFLLLVCATLVWFWEPLFSVVTLSFHEGRYGHYSHIVLIPFLCGYLLYHGRKTIFARMEWNLWMGVTLIGLGVVLSRGSAVLFDAEPNALSLQILSMVMVWWGAFSFCYGTRALRSASFGLLLLVFMVPLPSFLLEAIIGFLQRGTAEGVDFLFELVEVPVFRQGFEFTLPNLTIEIAEECSGIRSSLALLICSLMAGHLLLQSPWTKLGLIVAVVPLTIIKNAVRIVVLSVLANYVDPGFLANSALHRSGGIPLFFLSLTVLFGVLWLFRRTETTLRGSADLARPT